jgi:predicted alpha/beta-fold hydrolase
VTYIPRGCEALKSPRIFTLGGTDDLRSTLLYLRQQNPRASIVGVAFSLGANALVKYMGEYKDDPILCGGISMAQGYNAVTGIDHLHKVPFYERGLTWKLTRVVKKHSHHFRDLVDLDVVLNQKTVEDFDRHFTCKLLGFESPKEYYQAHSCANYVTSTSVPLFLLNAIDDPLVMADNIPFDAPNENENIILVTTQHGGHLGWCEGFLFPSLVHWHDRVALDVINAMLCLKKD